MASISGLYTALSGMNAQRRVLDVTAHNVANQATEGFHRQRVELQPAGIAAVASVFAGQGQHVGGVEVEGVIRMIDQLAEDRFVRESGQLAGATSLAADMSSIEQIFSEPSDQGIASLLDDFWGGWSDLASLPGDLATRSQTLERAQTLVDGIRTAAQNLEQIALTARNSVISLASDVNGLTARIAQLNSAITGSGNAANDLSDQRDVALRELAELTGAVGRPGIGGAIDVYIGGRVIVSGNIVQNVDGSGGVLTWEADGTNVVTGPSRASALATTINDVVPRYLGELDGVANQLVTTVNALHSVGYDQAGTTGWNFFEPTGVTATSIALSVDVDGQPARLAAGAPVLPGPVAPGPLDGEQARALAAIAQQTTGPDSSYKTMISGLGVETRAALRRQGIQEDVTSAAGAQAESVGGVSVDEEMANLISAQRAYEASARVLTTIDELLGVLMNTGRVGR